MKRGLIKLFIIISIFISPCIVLAAESETEVQFFNSFNDPYCYTPNAFESYWVLDGVLKNSASTAAGVGCYNESGFPSNYCCPLSMPNCTASYNCGPGPQRCSDITDKTYCETGNNIIAANDLETQAILRSETLDYVCEEFNDIYGESGNCLIYTSCYCEWDPVAGCIAIADQLIYNNLDRKFYNSSSDLSDLNALKAETICNATDDGVGKCEFSFNVIDNCESIGFLNRAWTATGPGIYCTDGSDRVPCLDVVKLPFFTLINGIIAVAIIVGIYFLITKK